MNGKVYLPKEMVDVLKKKFPSLSFNLNHSRVNYDFNLGRPYHVHDPITIEALPEQELDYIANIYSVLRDLIEADAERNELSKKYKDLSEKVDTLKKATSILRDEFKE